MSVIYKFVTNRFNCHGTIAFINVLRSTVGLFFKIFEHLFYLNFINRCSPTFIKLGNTGLAPCSKDFFHVSKMIICLQGWILYSNCVKDVKTDLKDRQFVIIILSYGWLQNRMVFTPTPPRPPYSHCIPEHYSFDNNFFHCSVLAAQFCLHYLSESCML